MKPPPLLVPVLAASLLAASAASPLAQTRITPPKNKYTPEQDVKLGQEAAAEVEKEYPIIRDDMIAGYLDEVGQRLVRAAPPDLDSPVYQYSFTPVDLKEINAFALPGGPMFVHRGMVEAAGAEAEMVGVMAHELAHVLLRHGTANLTKAQNPWLQLGQLAGVIGGAVVGGAAGAAISDGTQFGLGTFLLKYSREYEKQADLLGTQIMARAGYDPRALARMFETIQKESKGRAPQWLSSHPDPGNRTAYILKEAEALEVVNPVTDSAGFDRVRKKFAGMPPALTSEEAAKRAKARANVPADIGTLGQPVEPPSARFRTQQGGQLFRVGVPDNWLAVTSESNIKYVPRNAYGEANGGSTYTHGVELGVAKASSRDLGEATDDLLAGIGQANPQMREAGSPRYGTLAGRSAIYTPLTNRSEATRREETIGLVTTLLANGNLFYVAMVAPTDESESYRPVFQRVLQSVQLFDKR